MSIWKRPFWGNMGTQVRWNFRKLLYTMSELGYKPKINYIPGDGCCSYFKTGIWGRKLKRILENPYIPWVSMTTSQKLITYRGTDVIHILKYGLLFLVGYSGIFNYSNKGDESKIFLYMFAEQEGMYLHALLFFDSIYRIKTIHLIMWKLSQKRGTQLYWFILPIK